jgi:hypothetical protein
LADVQPSLIREDRRVPWLQRFGRHTFQTVTTASLSISLAINISRMKTDLALAAIEFPLSAMSGCPDRRRFLRLRRGERADGFPENVCKDLETVLGNPHE